MDEIVFCQKLQELLEESDYCFEKGLKIEKVRSFGNPITSNAGVVVTLNNDTEYLLTVERSK